MRTLKLEDLLTQDIHTDTSDYESYANCSLVRCAGRGTTGLMLFRIQLRYEMLMPILSHEFLIISTKGWVSS
jgi:hypothetical protein